MTPFPLTRIVVALGIVGPLALSVPTASQTMAATSAHSVCRNTQYFTGYDERVDGVMIRVSIHYRVNDDCTHNLYNNTYRVVRGPASRLRLLGSQDCGQADNKCTSAEFDSIGFSLPYTVNFSVTSTSSRSHTYIAGDVFCAVSGGMCTRKIYPSAHFSTR